MKTGREPGNILGTSEKEAT